jgi:hypothetical protein
LAVAEVVRKAAASETDWKDCQQDSAACEDGKVAAVGTADSAAVVLTYSCIGPRLDSLTAALGNFPVAVVEAIEILGYC